MDEVGVPTPIEKIKPISEYWWCEPSRLCKAYSYNMPNDKLHALVSYMLDKPFQCSYVHLNAWSTRGGFRCTRLQWKTIIIIFDYFLTWIIFFVLRTQGDSGGPLLINVSSVYYVVGKCNGIDSTSYSQTQRWNSSPRCQNVLNSASTWILITLNTYYSLIISWHL